MNRAKARLAHRFPADYASLYEEEFSWARTEVRETNGERFSPGPKGRHNR